MFKVSERRREQLTAMREKRHLNQVDFALRDSIRFAFAVIVEGQNYGAVEPMFTWLDIQIPSKRTFMRAQKKVLAIIQQMALRSCQRYREQMTEDSTISFDGSWSHRRNAVQCVVDFIDQRQKKIVDFEMVLKRSHRKNGNFEGASNLMKAEGLKRMVPRWINDERITAYVHDNDGKARTEIERQEWKIIEKLDPNHALKCFDRKYAKWNVLAGKKFYGLYDRLRRFLQSLIYKEMSIERKLELWNNAADHYCGDHTHCEPHGPAHNWRYANDQQAVVFLRNFLKKCERVLQNCDGNLSSQLNESFHALKAKYADKNYQWIESWEGRVCAAILQFNEPDHWKLELYERLGFPPLGSVSLKRMERIFDEREKQHEQRNVREHQQKEAQRRREKKKEKVTTIDGRTQPDVTDLAYRGKPDLTGVRDPPPPQEQQTGQPEGETLDGVSTWPECDEDKERSLHELAELF